MPEGRLAKKMKLQAAQRAALVNAPVGYMKPLSPLPEGVDLSQKLRDEFDWVQAFVKNRTVARWRVVGGTDSIASPCYSYARAFSFSLDNLRPVIARSPVEWDDEAISGTG